MNDSSVAREEAFDRVAASEGVKVQAVAEAVAAEERAVQALAAFGEGAAAATQTMTAGEASAAVYESARTAATIAEAACRAATDALARERSTLDTMLTSSAERAVQALAASGEGAAAAAQAMVASEASAAVYESAAAVATAARAAREVATDALSRERSTLDAIQASSAIFATSAATSLPEVWTIIATQLGLVSAWQLMRVCKAARSGAKEFLSTLPGFVVCGGVASGEGLVSEAWRLDLATMRWQSMPGLVTARRTHACCGVRGNLVVLGGVNSHDLISVTSSVEMLSPEEGAALLPPLSCGAVNGAVAIPVEESTSASGQVLLLGGWIPGGDQVSTVQLVDLATGVCTQQQDMLRGRYHFAAARLPDGRIVCAGGGTHLSSAEILGPPVQGAPGAAWTWRQLPAMSVARSGCGGCVMSDGRFAVIGGINNTNSCEALAIDANGEHWQPLPHMHDARENFAIAAVARCIIVAGGFGRKSAEIYDEVLDRWFRLPFDLPKQGGLGFTGSALM